MSTDYESLLNTAAELGYQLMFSGAEIYRVEESVTRLLLAYGVAEPQVFAIPNCLIISLTTPEGQSITRMSRIPSHGTDIELLERCNALCRNLCKSPVPLPQARGQVDELRTQRRSYRPRQVLAGYFIAPAFFTPLFGGGFWDGLAAGLCGLAVGWCVIFGRKLLGSNNFVRTIAASLAGALGALLLVLLGLGRDVDTITIGVFMVLVPGIALTNAMREIMAGDIISGLSRAAEAILTGAASALGAALALALWRAGMGGIG